MDIEKLKKQAEEIEARVARGETVSVNLRSKKEGVQPLDISSTEVTKGAPVGSAPKTRGMPSRSKRAPDSAAESSFDLDLSSVELSREEIAAKINAVREISEKSKTREMPKARGGAERSVEAVPPVILTLDDDRKNWLLHESCIYKTDDGVRLTAPKGYVTDLASIPRVFWSLLSPHELSLAAPVFHDLLYRCAGDLPDEQVDPVDRIFQRKEADDLFLELMKKTGVERWKRNVAYWAVRGFSGFAWKNQNLS